MIIPSIDLQGGKTVQLVGGKELAIDAGDPLPIAERFSLAGEIAVIDLDLAMSTGSNEELMLPLIKKFACRVGGGIRTLDRAKMWLDNGAEKIIIGTAATPEFLSPLPKERLIAAVDAVKGEVVIEGWTKKSGARLADQIELLRPYVAGFLVTFVEREGRMQGIDLDEVRSVVELANPARVTVAGGVTTTEEVRAIDELGADCQVGMAIYSGKLALADAIAAPLKSDRTDGLWPTVVCDEAGVCLGLAYSSLESLRQAVDTKSGVYHSRKRGIWRKGESSGAVQELLRVDLDCDRDTIRFIVKQNSPGFCHNSTWTCFGEDSGFRAVFRKLEENFQRGSFPEGSYTRRLLNDSSLLRAKLVEEAEELASASSGENAVEEAADLFYFAAVRLLKEGRNLSDVDRVLHGRSLKVIRRPGNAKQKQESEG